MHTSRFISAKTKPIAIIKTDYYDKKLTPFTVVKICIHTSLFIVFLYIVPFTGLYFAVYNARSVINLVRS